MSGRVAKETVDERAEARKAPREANLIGMVTKTKDPLGINAKAKVKARGKLDMATIAKSLGTSE